MRRLLLVTYQFPPIGGSGVQRVAKLASHLPEVGWRAHVVSAGHTHYPLLDPQLAHGLGDDVFVHRTCGLEPAGVAASVCRHMTRKGGTDGWLSDLEDRLYWRLDRLVGRLPLPEAEMLWAPAAIRQARRLVGRHEIEAVVTTSPPHSTHLVGLWLHRRLGLPWVADLRDPILDNFAYRGGGKRSDRYWRWIERRIVEDADRVVVTCPELGERLRSRYSHASDCRFVTITNGFDPADGPAARGEAAGNGSVTAFSVEKTTGETPVPQCCTTHVEGRCRLRRHSRGLRRPRGADVTGGAPRFTLSHVGAFYREQTVEPVLVAIRGLRSERADVARDLCLRLVGSLSASQRLLLREDDGAYVCDVGYRPHDEAIGEMGRADVLLLVTPANDGGRLCIPAKMFEYLAFGGHIIAMIHRGTAMWRILEEAGNVTLVDRREPDSLGGAIERCYDGWRSGLLNVSRDRRVVDRYRRDRLAARFAEVVEDCVAGSPSLRVTTGDEHHEEEAA